MLICTTHRVASLSLFLLYFNLISCGPKNVPEEVAEDFLFRYFIELNQQGALELSTGLAADKLKKEIQLLQSVRREPDLDLSKHKPFIDYKRVNLQKQQDGSLTFYYEVTIEKRDGVKLKREVVLSTIDVEGQWKVKNFDTFVK